MEFREVSTNLRMIFKGYSLSYPGYFREPHWKSMGLPEISMVTLTGTICRRPALERLSRTLVVTSWSSLHVGSICLSSTNMRGHGNSHLPHRFNATHYIVDRPVCLVGNANNSWSMKFSLKGFYVLSKLTNSCWLWILPSFHLCDIETQMLCMFKCLHPVAISSFTAGYL